MNKPKNLEVLESRKKVEKSFNEFWKTIYFFFDKESKNKLFSNWGADLKKYDQTSIDNGINKILQTNPNNWGMFFDTNKFSNTEKLMWLELIQEKLNQIASDILDFNDGLPNGKERAIRNLYLYFKFLEGTAFEENTTQITKKYLVAINVDPTFFFRILKQKTWYPNDKTDFKKSLFGSSRDFFWEYIQWEKDKQPEYAIKQLMDKITKLKKQLEKKWWIIKETNTNLLDNLQKKEPQSIKVNKQKKQTVEQLKFTF